MPPDPLDWHAARVGVLWTVAVQTSATRGDLKGNTESMYKFRKCA